MGKYRLLTNEDYLYILNNYHDLINQHGEKCDIFRALEYHKLFFIKNLIDSTTHYNESLLFEWCFQIYINTYDETGTLPYRKQISIHYLLNEEEYFFDEYGTRDMLNTLRNMNLITFCDFKEDCFFLNFEKETLLHFLTNRERIATGKYPIAIDEYIVNKFKEKQIRNSHLKILK